MRSDALLTRASAAASLVVVCACAGSSPRKETDVRLPQRTGDGEVVYHDDCVGGFAVDGDRIYLSNTTSVRADGKGDPRQYTTRPGLVLAVDASHVYLVDEQAMFRARKDGTQVESIFSVQGGGADFKLQDAVGDFELDEAAAYFLAPLRPTESLLALLVAPKGGGAARVLVDPSSGFFPVEIAVDADNVYFTDRGFDWAADSPDMRSVTGAVHVVPKAGGPVRTIARLPTTGDRSETNRIMPLAIDERFAYFGSSESGSIFRASKQDGSVDEIDGGGYSPGFILAGRDRLAVLSHGYADKLELRFVSKDRRATHAPDAHLGGEPTSVRVAGGFVYVGSDRYHAHEGCVSGTIVRVPFD